MKDKVRRSRSRLEKPSSDHGTGVKLEKREGKQGQYSRKSLGLV